MPVNSKNCNRYQLFGLQAIGVDTSGTTSSNIVTTHMTVPYKCAIEKITMDANTTTANIKSAFVQLKDNAGAVIATRNPAGTSRKQTSLFEIGGTGAENNALNIKLQCPENGVQIDEDIYISGYYLDTSSGNQASGDNMTVVDAAGTFATVTHTWQAGEEEAPAYFDAVASTLNGNAAFVAAGFYAGIVQVAPDKAYLVIYKRGSGSAVMNFGEVGTWGGTGQDVTAMTGGSAPRALAFLASAVIVRCAEENGFAQATDGTKCRPISALNSIGAIETDGNNKPFDLTITVVSGSCTATVEQQALIVDDAANGLTVGDKAIVAPAAGYVELSEDDQIEIIIEDQSASGAVVCDVTSQILVGPPVGAKVSQVETGIHAEVSHSSLKTYSPRS